MSELAKRDEALETLREVRAGLVSQAKVIALEIARSKGYVTAPMVLAAMREVPELQEQLEDVDPRFIGAAFRKDDDFQPEGWTMQGGSHGRPVRIWSLLTAVPEPTQQ